MQLSQLITLLIDEVSASEEELLNHAVTLCQESDDPALAEELEAAAADYSAFCQRLGAATESVSLHGLSRLAHTLAEGLGIAGSLPAELRVPALSLLIGFGSAVAEYLRLWRDGQALEPLVDRLMQQVTEAEFLVPLDEHQRVELFAALLAPPSRESQQSELVTPFEPLAGEQLDLSVPEDADPGLLESFLGEAPHQLLRLSDTVQALGSETTDERLEEAHRIAHTLKGSAAIAGVVGFATLAHALEDILEAYRQDDFVAPPGLHCLLLKACDQLDAAIGVITDAQPVDADFAGTAHALHAWAGKLQGQDVPDAWLDPAAMALRPDPGHAMAEPDARHIEIDRTSAAQTPTSPGVTEEEPQVRVPTRALDLVFRAINELSIGLQRLRAENEGLIARIDGQTQLHAAADARLRDIEQQVVVEGLGQVRAISADGLAPTASTWATAADNGFDTLELDQYNALVGDAQALREALGDLRSSRDEVLGGLRDSAMLAQRQLQLAKEAQHQIARARLRSLSELRSRLRRTVRQACEAVGHEAELHIDGDDLRVDAAVLGPLSECLMHLLRNAVDHGIEPPEERLACGKSASGSILVRFMSHGGGVVVRIIDDGRGLDHEAILNKAIARGLVPSEAQLSQEQIGRLIFLAGFSTRSAITQTSGRGVGLDVVAKAVAGLQGQVSVQSQFGQGSEFRLFVLASVGTLHALHIEEGGEHFLVPSIQLIKAETPDNEAPDEVDLIPLSQLLHGRARHRPDAGTGVGVAGPQLYLNVDGQVRRVEVQRVVEAREFLFSPPPQMLERSPGLTGVATLGDGSLALVLDLVDLCRTPLPLQDMGRARLEAEALHQSHVLVVDDSASVRNTLSTLLRDQNYQVTTARNGLEAMQVIHQRRFSLVLTDLEMPQVNGFELTEFIRQRSSQGQVPVVMLTSRGQDKHRQRALRAGVSTFLVKPYSDQQLLHTVQELVAATPQSGQAAWEAFQ